jgi:hypothetical protein
VFDGINAAFGTVSVRYEPSNKLTERDYTAGVMTVPRGEMEDLCGQPPLQVLLAEAVTATRAKATVLMVRDGKTVFGEDKKPLYEVDGALFMANLPLVLEGVYAWAAQAGGSLTKPVGKVRAAKAPRTPKVPGTSSMNRYARYPDSAIIRLTGTPCRYKAGTPNARYFAVIRDGMAVAEYRKAFQTAKKSIPGHQAATTQLRYTVDAGLITVS